MDANGNPKDDLLKTYRSLSAGGAGAIITGYVGMKQNGKTLPNMRMFDSDVSVDACRSMNDQLKQYNAPLILQIAHGGRSMFRITGQDVVSAAWLIAHGDRYFLYFLLLPALESGKGLFHIRCC